MNSSLKHGRLLEKEHFPLRHFFIVCEHILLHGYIGKKSFPISSLSNRKDLWPIIDLIARKSTDAHISEIFTSTKEMTNIRTSLGRVRAWLRLALMQKRLSDYFKILVEQKQELKDLYDNEALLLSEESPIIAGLLVGLNVLDFNFCLKEAAFDYSIESTIHYSLYLRERRGLSILSKNAKSIGATGEAVDKLDDYRLTETAPSSSKIGNNEQNDETVFETYEDDTETSDENHLESTYDRHMSTILDQKHYIEEMNRNLQLVMKVLIIVMKFYFSKCKNKL